MLEQAGLKSIYAVAKAIDEVGNKTKTQVVRSVAAQAGVKYGRALGVIHSKQAMGAGEGSYQIIARDRAMSLKEFGPKQTKTKPVRGPHGRFAAGGQGGGVWASPWHKKQFYKHAFIGPGGHVFVRMGKQRLPIHKLFGPIIPKEMVKDETEALFFRYTAQALPDALGKWLLRAV